MNADNDVLKDLPVVEVEAVERLKEWGGAALARKMVEIFLSSTTERMDQIREGVSTGKPEISERGGHSLKSSAGNVGATRLQRLAEKAEALSHEKEMESLADLLPDLEEAYGEACSVLEELLGGME